MQSHREGSAVASGHYCANSFQRNGKNCKIAHEQEINGRSQTQPDLKPCRIATHEHRKMIWTHGGGPDFILGVYCELEWVTSSVRGMLSLNCSDAISRQDNSHAYFFRKRRKSRSGSSDVSLEADPLKLRGENVEEKQNCFFTCGSQVFKSTYTNDPSVQVDVRILSLRIQPTFVERLLFCGLFQAVLSVSPSRWLQVSDLSTCCWVANLNLQ